MVDILLFNLVWQSKLTLSLTNEKISKSSIYYTLYAKVTFSLYLRIIEMYVFNIVEHSIT